MNDTSEKIHVTIPPITPGALIMLKAERDLLKTERDELRTTLADCQDFLSAIVDATTGAGRIDENSVMRTGQRLKTTARILNDKARAVLERTKP